MIDEYEARGLPAAAQLCLCRLALRDLRRNSRASLLFSASALGRAPHLCAAHSVFLCFVTSLPPALHKLSLVIRQTRRLSRDVGGTSNVRISKLILTRHHICKRTSWLCIRFVLPLGHGACRCGERGAKSERAFQRKPLLWLARLARASPHPAATLLLRREHAALPRKPTTLFPPRGHAAPSAPLGRAVWVRCQSGLQRTIPRSRAVASLQSAGLTARLQEKKPLALPRSPPDRSSPLAQARLAGARRAPAAAACAARDEIDAAFAHQPKPLHTPTVILVGAQEEASREASNTWPGMMSPRGKECGGRS
jgi:hypothetical protein